MTNRRGTPTRPQREVLSAAFLADGSRVLTGSWDGTARVFDARTGKSICTFHGHEAMPGPQPNHVVWAGGFSPDGSRAVTGGNDGTARVWDAATGTEVAVFRGHGATVSAGCFADGRKIATAGEDQTVRVWDVASGTELIVLRGPMGLVTAVGFSPDGSRPSSPAATTWWPGCGTPDPGGGVQVPRPRRRGRRSRVQHGRASDRHAGRDRDGPRLGRRAAAAREVNRLPRFPIAARRPQVVVGHTAFRNGTGFPAFPMRGWGDSSESPTPGHRSVRQATAPGPGRW